MSNTINGSQYISEPASNRSLSLGCADIPDEMVTGAVGAIISRIAPAYLELMREAKEKPEIISDYRSSLSLMEAQKMASDCSVVTKTLSPEKRISVFSEKNREFDENQALDNARVYIRLRINAKDIKEEDPLDLLLSQLSKKIFSQGYGDKGTFDIRLEKGCLSLEGRPWRWHFDQTFKTSITVCYSNKANWSTHVSDMESEGPADHGFLYDALAVYHRAPIPSDLEGEDLNADDYRLFIRYNEFYTEGESPLTKRTEKKEGEVPPSPSDYKPIHKITKLEHSPSKEQSPANVLVSHYATHLVDSKLTEDTFANLTLDLTDPPKYNFPELRAELRSATESPSSHFIDITTEDYVLPIAVLPNREQNRCTVM